ncbi:MAG TPA: glutathione S-transferase family protein [Polyangiaceae bacterium]|jgi:glutathione S-transferase|nr:glutathione S-transferase family protein [Polyangiaceae bacterium]
MSLTLYFHPLASYCWKVLLALYESDTPFEPHNVDLGDPAARADLERLWPIAKFPVLRDVARNVVVPESTIIVEYLAEQRAGARSLIPTEPELAREVRLADRFYDQYVHERMQKIVGDRLRPAERRDAYGVEKARADLDLAYRMIDEAMRAREWAAAGAFTLADCAAAPALYYANRVQPLGERYPHAARYLGRLLARPSFQRVLAEAEPYFKYFPAEE